MMNKRTLTSKRKEFLKNMTTNKKILIIALFSCFLNQAWATDPCEQIIQACRQAGFAKKEYKQGKGIERDCINPIMQNTVAPNAIPLPPISQNSQVIAECRAKRPKFGTGKVGM
jgi:hypothetical protein